LGGALMSLNIRVAREIFRRGWPLTHPELAMRIRELCGDASYRRRPERERLTDEQVRKFVREALGTSPSLACSPLLAQLRRSHQLACEQKRFKRLYGEVVEAMNTGIDPDHSISRLGHARPNLN
jgi:hypothetical protein